MRLLIVSQYFWPEEFRINDIALGLQSKGHKVTVLTGIPNYPGGKFFRGYGLFSNLRQDFKGVTVLRVQLIPRGKGGELRLVLNYVSFAVSACILGPLFCRGKFDLIFVCQLSPVTVGLPALVMKKMKQAPIVFWVQDLWPDSLSATGAIRSPRILKWVEKLVHFIYRGCDAILVQSEAFYSSIEKAGINRGRIRYFPNSAEELYKPITSSRNIPEQSSIPNGFRIMFAGNIGVAQDFETILLSAERLKSYSDIHWIILGDGRMLPWVRDQVEFRGLNNTVHLLGKHPVEAMPEYFSLADVLLVSLKKSPIFSLTIPAKVQSYLACGKPIIAALEGEGARIILEARAGLVSPPGNPEELANAVLEMFQKSEADRQAIGGRGRQYFEAHFDRNMLLGRLAGWFYEFTKENYGW